jgi:hypothetical protein
MRKEEKLKKDEREISDKKLVKHPVNQVSIKEQSREILHFFFC